ncbi:hypothetical protein SAMN05421823_101556 [Catalinimonas alkaloidigena]|uniref:Uncharacterized protein n=1 Tax=Catalinimonas alkaloidigena TaxID=1075417 RepID=A0A1G8Y3L6_9BACT|nr:hypothetical protein [Catalinimonas alkaloidigena]SDJ97253.1 hypothetical protein SAMN05421823_101556 [Catalinimonas alkaloidigena]
MLSVCQPKENGEASQVQVNDVLSKPENPKPTNEDLIVSKDSLVKKSYVKGDLGGEVLYYYNTSSLKKLVRDISSPEYFTRYDEFIFKNDSVSDYYTYEKDQLYEIKKSFVEERKVIFSNQRALSLSRKDTIPHTYENLKLEEIDYDTIEVDFDSTYFDAVKSFRQITYESQNKGINEFIIVGDLERLALGEYELPVKNLFGFDEKIILKEEDPLTDSLIKNHYNPGDTVVIRWEEVFDGDIPLKYYRD